MRSLRTHDPAPGVVTTQRTSRAVKRDVLAGLALVLAGAATHHAGGGEGLAAVAGGLATLAGVLALVRARLSAWWYHG